MIPRERDNVDDVDVLADASMLLTKTVHAPNFTVLENHCLKSISKYGPRVNYPKSMDL